MSALIPAAVPARHRRPRPPPPPGLDPAPRLLYPAAVCWRN